MCAFAARERCSESDDMQRHRAQKHSIKLFVTSVPHPRRDPRVFVAVRRSSAAARMLFLQKSAVSETLGVIANVPHPPALWRCLREHKLSQAPHLYKIALPFHSFCQGIAPKNFAGTAR